MILCILGGCSTISVPDTPDIVVRKMFQANANRDIPKTIESLVSKDADMVGYTVGGRKYVGWNDLAQDIELSLNR